MAERVGFEPMEPINPGIPQSAVDPIPAHCPLPALAVSAWFSGAQEIPRSQYPGQRGSHLPFLEEYLNRAE